LRACGDLVAALLSSPYRLWVAVDVVVVDSFFVGALLSSTGIVDVIDAIHADLAPVYKY